MSVNHVLTLTKVLGRRPTEKEVGALMVELTKGHKKLNAKSKGIRRSQTNTGAKTPYKPLLALE